MAKDSVPTVAECEEMAVNCVSHNLRRASRAMTQLYDAYFDELGLKATQYTVLSALAWSEDKPLPIGELAEILVLDQSSLSRNLAVLERLELILLEPSRTDRRERIVHLTKDGRAMVARGFPIWKKVQAVVQTAVEGALEEHVKSLRRLTRTAQELRPQKARRSAAAP
jgi:DNA-binding MarR family transcriptional regulator